MIVAAFMLSTSATKKTSRSACNPACEIYGKIKIVDYGEDFKIKWVDYGEDFKVKFVDYGEGC